MKSFTYTITDPQGMHARPAGSLVKAATNFESQVMIEKDGRSVDAKRIFGIMGLGIKEGDEVRFEIAGNDEDQAAAELEVFMQENL